MANEETQPGRRTRIWRVARTTTRVLGFVCVLVLVAIALLLGTVPGRQAILHIAVPRVTERLPGEFSLVQARWPALGRIELTGLLWMADGDTLLAADECGVDVSLGELLRRNVYVERVWLAGLMADLPAIQAGLPPATPPAADSVRADSLDSDDRGEPFFPREGAVAGIPSVGLGELSVTAAELRLGPERHIFVDQLVVSADLRTGHAAQVSAALRSRPLRDLGFVVRMEAAIGDSLVARLTPLTFVPAESTTAIDLAALPLDGRLATAMDALRGGEGLPPGDIRGLRIEGVLGEVWLDGVLHPTGDGAVHLRVRRPQSPRYLLGALAHVLDDNPPALAMADSLWGLWPRGDQPDIDLTCTLRPPAGKRSLKPGKVTLAGHFTLPGPSELAPLLPPELETEDLSGLRGEIQVEADLSGELPIYAGVLDLGATDWLDACRVAVRGEGERIQLDSLHVALFGTVMDIGGTIAENLDLAAELVMQDASLLKRWRNEQTADLDLRLSLSATVHGPRAAPALDADFEIDVAKPDLAVEGLRGHLRFSDPDVDLQIEIASGLTLGPRSFETVKAAFTGELPDSTRPFAGRFFLAAQGEAQSIGARGAVSAGDALSLTVDSLDVAYKGHHLTARRPFSFLRDPARSLLRLTDLDLVGDPGRIRCAGGVTPDSLGLDLAIDLRLQRALLIDLLPGTANVLAETDTLFVRGDARFAGTPAAPVGYCALESGVRGREALSALTLALSLWLLPPEETTVAGFELPDFVAEPPADAPHPGVAAALRLDSQGSPRLTGNLRYPASFSLLPLSLEPSDAGTFMLSVDSEMIELSELQRFLPPGITVNGQCRLAAEIASVGEEYAVTGKLEVPAFEGRMGDGSWISMYGHVDLAGTLRSPSIAGRIDVEGGLLRIPEIPKQLHPVEGEAMLWTTSGAHKDSLAAGAEEMPAEALPAPVDTTAAAAGPDVTLVLSCPNNLWLRGHGLDVELAGDLRGGLRAGRPAVDGELRAVQGTFKFMGRVFTVERGVVLFYGDEAEIDPELDLSLTTDLEGTRYRIEVTGKATKPKLRLTSDPSMSESDIISALLFGKPLSELSGGEEDLLRQRSQQILAAYGMVKVQDHLSRELGVDLVSYKPAEGKDEASSLLIGKYLNPKVMVSYEQVLDRDTAFFVHLHYVLNRYVKVQTSISQGGKSGIELEWSRDY